MRPVYVATLTQDETGYWTGVVTVRPQLAAISDGPTLDEMRVRMRQAVAALIEADEGSFDLDVRFGAQLSPGDSSGRSRI